MTTIRELVIINFNELLLTGIKTICFNIVPKSVHTVAIGAVVLGSLVSHNAIANNDSFSTGDSMIERSIEMGAEEAMNKYKGCLEFSNNKTAENFCIENKDFNEKLENYKTKLEAEIEKAGHAGHCSVSIEGYVHFSNDLDLNYELNVGNVSYNVTSNSNDVTVEVSSLNLDSRCNLDKESTNLIKDQIQKGFSDYKEILSSKLTTRGIASK